MSSVRFTRDEVAKLIALARSAPCGRTPIERIEEFLDQLRPLLPHDSSNVMVIEPSGPAVTPVHVRTITMRDLADYADHYRFVDPMGHCLIGVRWRGVRLSDFATPREVGRTEFSDLLGRSRVKHILGITIPLADGRLFALAVQRVRGRKDFDERERTLLELAAPVLADAFEWDERGAGTSALTRRELTIARLAASGLGDREIARRLGIGFSTVRTHLQRTFAKLRVSNRTELAARLAELER